MFEDLIIPISEIFRGTDVWLYLILLNIIMLLFDSLSLYLSLSLSLSLLLSPSLSLLLSPSLSLTLSYCLPLSLSLSLSQSLSFSLSLSLSLSPSLLSCLSLFLIFSHTFLSSTFIICSSDFHFLLLNQTPSFLLTVIFVSHRCEGIRCRRLWSESEWETDDR